MSDLNRELKEYLSRNDKSADTESLLPTTMKDIKLPKISNWFNREENGIADDVETANQDNNGSSSWFSSAQKDPLLPSLGRKQRIFGFLGCVTMGLICFSLSAVYAPLIILKARKFCLLFTLGSLFTVLSFSFLWGPVNHLKHLFSSERIFFTSVYLTSLFGTLYAALSMQSVILSCVFAGIQVVALFCFILSNIPGGQTGIKFMSSMCSSLLKKICSRAFSS